MEEIATLFTDTADTGLVPAAEAAASGISGRQMRPLENHEKTHLAKPLTVSPRSHSTRILSTHASLSHHFVCPHQIYIDGPFGAPASNIFRAEHAVLVGAGIGVTPFSSILQSIMHRFWASKKQCPSCSHRWTDEPENNLLSLKKVGTC